MPQSSMVKGLRAFADALFFCKPLNCCCHRRRWRAERATKV